MANDIQKLKEALTQSRHTELLYLLIPVCWGSWNIIAATTCIILPNFSKGIIWGVMMTAGALTQIILYKWFRTQKGFMLSSISNVGKIWLIIIIALGEALFFLNIYAPVINTTYFLSIVAIFIGVGFAITGIVVKTKSEIIIGLLWIASSNLFAAITSYFMHVYIGVIAITMIIIPSIAYLLNRGKSNA